MILDWICSALRHGVSFYLLDDFLLLVLSRNRATMSIRFVIKKKSLCYKVTHLLDKSLPVSNGTGVDSSVMQDRYESTTQPCP